MNSLQTMKQKGRALRKHLEAAFGKEVSLSEAYEALAAMEGAENWNAFSASLVAPQAAHPLVVQSAEAVQPTVLRDDCVTLPIRAYFVLDVDLGQPKHQRLLYDICATTWESAMDGWKKNAAPPACEYIIESSDIYQALGDHGVTGTAEEGGFHDDVAQIVENALSHYGYHLQARLLYESDADINDSFKPDYALEVKEGISEIVAASPLFPIGVEDPAEPVVYSAEGRFDTLKVIEVNLVDVLNEYDVPEDAPEWNWVEKHHSFAHKGNGGEPGVWEFMVNVEMFAEPESCDEEGMPDTLRPFFDQAKKDGAVWVMFHQG